MTKKTGSSQEDQKSQVSVAKIGALSAIAVVIVTGVFALLQNPPKPVPAVTVTSPSNFSYVIRVQSKKTGQPISNSDVLIEVIGQAPLHQATDSNGYARVLIEGKRVGQPAKLSIQATGYSLFTQNIDLRQDTLPDVIQLDSVGVTNQSTSNPAPQPQQARWGPVDGLAAGACLNSCDNFIEWQLLKVEIERKLLPQVGKVPLGSTVRLNDIAGKQDWAIEVVGPSGNSVGNVWVGPDPFNNWAFDGLIRVGFPGPPAEVWDSFQRYSDGSYRKR